MTPLKAGLLYGGLAFAAGATLGPVRELLLAPYLGGMAAALIEGAAMMGMLWLAARSATGRVAMLTPRARIVVAAAGVALVVLVAEAALGILLEASDTAASRAPRGLGEHAVGLALLAWMAALPFLVRRHAVAVP